MTQRLAQISHGNLPPLTGIKKKYYKITVWIELRQADSFEHWLVIVLAQKFILDIFLTQ